MNNNQNFFSNISFFSKPKPLFDSIDTRRELILIKSLDNVLREKISKGVKYPLLSTFSKEIFNNQLMQDKENSEKTDAENNSKNHETPQCRNSESNNEHEYETDSAEFDKNNDAEDDSKREEDDSDMDEYCSEDEDSEKNSSRQQYVLRPRKIRERSRSRSANSSESDKKRRR